MIVQVSKLTKEFRVPVRKPGLRAGLRSLVRREFKAVEAVRSVSFDIAEGEVVGFLGPNGAGKTTTLKMLTGLLHPTAGDVQVMGFTPWQRERAYLRTINMVMGNRHQLTWDVPTLDSYLLMCTILRQGPADFRDSGGLGSNHACGHAVGPFAVVHDPMVPVDARRLLHRRQAVLVVGRHYSGASA